MEQFYVVITLVIILNSCKTAESKMTIEQIKNTMKPFKTKCLRVTGIDPAMVEGTKMGIWAEDRVMMCFTKCMYVLMKAIKDDDISLKAIFTAVDLMVPEEFVPRMKEIAEKCLISANAKAEDLCEKCWMHAKCFQQTDSSLYFFP